MESNEECIRANYIYIESMEKDIAQLKRIIYRKEMDIERTKASILIFKQNIELCFCKCHPKTGQGWVGCNKCKNLHNNACAKSEDKN